MKRLLIVIALLCLMALPAMAATLTFQWDAMPSGQTWTQVRIYEKSGTNYTLLGSTTSGTATSMTVSGITPGAHNFVARSYDGAWESADSNVLVTGPVPSAPGNFKITAVVMAAVGALGFVIVWVAKKILHKHG
jgi:hypothetical protein